MHTRRKPWLSPTDLSRYRRFVISDCRVPPVESTFQGLQVRHDTAPLVAVDSVEREAKPSECLDEVALGIRDLTIRRSGRQREKQSQKRRCACPHDGTLQVPDYRRQFGGRQRSYNFSYSGGLAVESIGFP